MPARILRPEHAPALLPVVVYVHGAGWTFGSRHTHDRLIREIAVGAGAAVVFPEYSLSPEAKYPVAVEERLRGGVLGRGSHGIEHGLDPSRMAVGGRQRRREHGNRRGRPARGAERHGAAFRQQVLFYPVTDASFDTGSYEKFATGYFLRRDAMQWFWNPCAGPTRRNGPWPRRRRCAPPTGNSRPLAARRW